MKSEHKSMLNESNLGPWRERLLIKLLDGECCAPERWLVHRMLERNRAAAEAFERLKSDREVLKSALEVSLAGDQDAGTVDLWDRISKRIDIEERSALLIGKRNLSTSVRPALLDSLSSGLTWGISGAVAAAMVIFVFANSASIDVGNGFNSGQLVSSRAPENPGFSNVSLGSGKGKKAGTPQILERRYPVTLEVDWMRSDGRVRVMSGESERSPIIWVKRRKPAGRGLFDVEPGNPVAPQPQATWAVIDRNGR
jgi:hypothetical protein